MRCLFVIFTIVACCINSSAQQKQGFVGCPNPRNINEMGVIDTGNVRIWYSFNADDLDDIKSYVDLQCLEVGKVVSKYYSLFVATSDSLCCAWRQQRPNAQSVPRWLGEGGKKPLIWSEYQYSELFKTEKDLTEYARMPLHFNQYDSWHTELYPLQQWSVQTDTLTVCGYLCQKATCTFRGRDFEAWFTPDIPVSNGPWKFGGLPGLILKVYDTRHLYTFECVRIEQGVFPIKKYDYAKYKPIKREKLLDLQRKLNENYLKMGGAVDRRTKQRLSRYTPYEPLELE